MKLLQLESLVFCDQENDKNSDDDENDEHDAAGTTPVDAGSDVEVNFTTTNLANLSNLVKCLWPRPRPFRCSTLGQAPGLTHIHQPRLGKACQGQTL
jgi:hypothetical protein